MTTDPFNLQQQVLLCQQIARLVRANLPLTENLVSHSSELSSEFSKTGLKLQNQLAQGVSLVDALVKGDTADSRILAACLTAGQTSNCLDQALESWTSMHIANEKSKKSLRIAMIYPLALVLIALLAVGWTSWNLVPEIQSAYVQFHSVPPQWLEWIITARDHFTLTLMAIALTVIGPIVYWFVKRHRKDRFGVPLNLPRRLRLQALASQLASWQLQAKRPLSETLPLCLQAMGASKEQSRTAFEDMRLNRTLASLPIETTMILASLHSGILNQSQAMQHCQKIGIRLSEQADLHEQNECRWLPVFVGLLVGTITLFAYGLLVYLPWIGLMTKLGLPTH